MITLRKYQQDGANFLAKGSSALLFDTGLGKTFTSLEACKLVGAKNILILVPKSIIGQWRDEARAYWPEIPVKVMSGSKAEKYDAWQNYRGGILVTNYETLLGYHEQFKATEWSVIICDEVQRIANATTKTYKKLITLKAKYRWGLTATAVQNSPLDVHGIFSWINPSLLPNRWRFEMDYTIKGHFRNIVGYRNLDHLAEKIKPYYIRRTVEEVASDLPEKIITTVPVELSDKERKLYDRIKKEVYHELTGGQADKIPLSSLGSAITNLVRLRQVVGHSSIIGTDHKKSSKIEALKELIEQQDKANKIIVFSEFAEVCKIVSGEIADYNPFLFIGATSSEDREAILEEFKNNPARRILICSSAGGVGLNLQTASVIIHYDMPFSLGKMIQREGRIHRIGQQKTCLIYNLVATKTIDEFIVKKLAKKQEFSETLITVEDIAEILS